jgi:hypothetical protein
VGRPWFESAARAYSRNKKALTETRASRKIGSTVARAASAVPSSVADPASYALLRTPRDAGSLISGDQLVKKSGGTAPLIGSPGLVLSPSSDNCAFRIERQQFRCNPVIGSDRGPPPRQTVVMRGAVVRTRRLKTRNRPFAALRPAPLSVGSAAIAAGSGRELGSRCLARSRHRLTRHRSSIDDRYRGGSSHPAWQAAGTLSNRGRMSATRRADSHGRPISAIYGPPPASPLCQEVARRYCLVARVCTT